MAETNYYVSWDTHMRKALSTRDADVLHHLQSYDRKEVVGEAFGNYLLECYCNHVRSERSQPWQALKGRKAAELIAIEKHHWLPNSVEGLDDDQLRLALHAELYNHKLSEKAYMACAGDLKHAGLAELAAQYGE